MAPISNPTLTHGRGSGDGNKGNQQWQQGRASSNSKGEPVWVYVDFGLGLCSKSCGFVFDDARKSTMSYTVNTRSQRHLHNTKKRGPNREHWCGAGRIPSKGQVRTSHNSRVLERGKLCVPWLVRVLRLL